MGAPGERANQEGGEATLGRVRGNQEGFLEEEAEPWRTGGVNQVKTGGRKF